MKVFHTFINIFARIIVVPFVALLAHACTGTICSLANSVNMTDCWAAFGDFWNRWTVRHASINPWKSSLRAASRFSHKLVESVRALQGASGGLLVPRGFVARPSQRAHALGWLMRKTRGYLQCNEKVKRVESLWTAPCDSSLLPTPLRFIKFQESVGNYKVIKERMWKKSWATRKRAFTGSHPIFRGRSLCYFPIPTTDLKAWNRLQ